MSGQTSVYHQKWDYDPMGNRLHTYTSQDGSQWGVADYYHYKQISSQNLNNQLIAYGPVNDYQSTGNTRFTYDDWGNTCTRIAPSVGTTSYGYDARNQMTGISYPDTSTNSFGDNTYGLRSQKVDSAGISNYLYDGMSMLSETSALYTWGEMGISSMVRGGATYWYLIDGLGSVRQVILASNGTIAKSYDYDAWGNVTAQSGTLTNPYQFVGSLGYYTDLDSGLIHVGYRQYDPKIGRWVTEDPIGLEGGNNLYGYVGLMPTMFVDPLGMIAWGKGIGTIVRIALPIGSAIALLDYWYYWDMCMERIHCAKTQTPHHEDSQSPAEDMLIGIPESYNGDS